MVHQRHQRCVSALGIVRSGSLCAPLDRDLSYVDIGVEALKEWELYKLFENCECFAFHASCWKLLLLRLGCDQAGHFPDETVIAESVFHLLYCTPSLHGSSFQFGHDYEGAAQTHKPFGRPRTVASGSRFYADPCAIPSMDELENYRKESSACASSFAGTDDDRPAVPLPCGTRRESRETLETPHIFDGLSPELQYEILSYLSFAELLNMRLVCRDLALFTAPDMLPQSYWRRIATGTLDISEKSNAPYLVAGLDRFKIVSLGLGELVDHPGASLKTPSQDWSRVQSHLWTPHPPRHEELTISPLLPAQSPRAFEPLTNIDFGGPRGLLLGSLSRLALHMVSTNYGRTATFAPLSYRLNVTVGTIPIVPPENTITGLVAVDPKCQNRFDKVGIQSQHCEEQLIEPETLDRECHQVPDDQIRYDEKFSHFIGSSNPGNHQTYASLKNVRRIQASTGMRGRSRSSNRICGLKFQYYNHPSPGIVGQWMNELDEDGFGLSPDEEVRSLTIWLTTMGFCGQTPGRELGQIVAIRIETTHSRSVTFRSPDFHTLPARTLQHQFQCDAAENLTAISWIMNESYECVRAVTSPDENGKIQVLIPERGAPFDQVRKLYFERQNRNGSREGIVTAEAYFRDEAIVGLVFTYASGARTGIGELETDTHQRIQFERHERIVGMSAGALDHSLMEIGFEVGQDEPRYKTLGLPTTSPADGDPYDGYDWRDVWRRDGSSADYHSLAGGGSVYDPPSESRLVGIYVGCQDFCDVGAVYEPV
ncbi:hypothetical protein HFD88_007567 [Aspergillus terreus]|nr:hypothetical protein HFD88_007567 [Aspergillus terreus]